MRVGSYVKIIGIKFDVIEGIEIVADANRRDYKEAGEFAENHSVKNIVWISIPCEYHMD